MAAGMLRAPTWIHPSVRMRRERFMLILPWSVLTRVALMQENKPQGKLSEVWASSLDASGVAQADVSAALSELLASKDAADIQKAKKAAFLGASVMQKRAVPELESESQHVATMSNEVQACSQPVHASSKA